MFPIKFRARVCDEDELNVGKIVYGSFIDTEFGSNHFWIYVPSINHSFPVNRDSVQQLVGYDADGNEVYEGDVLVLEHDGNIFEYTAHLKAFATADNGCYIADFSNLKLKEVA